MNIVTALYRRYRSRVMADLEETESQAENQRRLSELDKKLLEHSSTLIDTSLGPGERIVSRHGDDGELYDNEDFRLDRLRQVSRRLWYKNPHGRAILRNLVRYIGVPSVKSDIPSDEPLEIWRRFWRKTRMTRRWKEIKYRSFRDGDVFIRMFPDEETLLQLRFIDPSRIASPPDADFSHGIETDPDDVERPLRYWKLKKNRSGTSTKDFEPIDASEIWHIKINADSDMKRGRPHLEPVIGMIMRYDAWLSDRIILNKLRTAIAMVKKVNAPRETIDRLRQAQQANHPRGRQNVSKAPAPGSLITASRHVDYEFLSPNLDARDVATDGRAILLAMTTGVGQSEVLTTGDASNQNYASSLVAEGPVSREIVDWREFYDDELYFLWCAVMKEAISRELIEETLTVDVEVIDKDGDVKMEKRNFDIMDNVIVSWPELTQRNIKDETLALNVQHKMGVVSLQTVAGKLGYEYRQERRLRLREAKELEQNPDPFLSPDAQLPTSNELSGEIKADEDIARTDT